MPALRERFPRTPAASILIPAGILLFLGSCSKKEQTVKEAQPVGSTVVFAAASGGVSKDRLAAMRWQDVAPTAEATLRHGLIAEVLESSAEVTAEPCLYLRGMLELAGSHPDRALAEWGKITVADIPPDFLYAPWRIASAEAGENRYDSPLAAAVSRGDTNPLITARWHAFHADYVAALYAYLRSDPAQWTPHEVTQFRVMKLQEPISTDVDRMLAGALRGTRVPEALRVDLAHLIKKTPQLDKEKIASLLKSDPDFAAAAVRGVRDQLDLRQAFAASRFSDVVAQVRDLDPATAPTETVLLAFLAASKTGDHEIADLWAEELLRRKPGTETEKWITDIQASSR